MSTTISDSELVRQTVTSAFERLDPNFTIDCLEDRFLVENGEFRGRSFRANQHFAMWFCEMEIVQIYNEDGDLVEFMDLKQVKKQTSIQKHAA